MKLKNLENNQVFMRHEKGEGKLFVRSFNDFRSSGEIPAFRIILDTYTKKLRYTTNIIWFKPNTKVIPINCMS